MPTFHSQLPRHSAKSNLHHHPTPYLLILILPPQLITATSTLGRPSHRRCGFALFHFFSQLAVHHRRLPTRDTILPIPASCHSPLISQSRDPRDPRPPPDRAPHILDRVHGSSAWDSSAPRGIAARHVHVGRLPSAAPPGGTSPWLHEPPSAAAAIVAAAAEPLGLSLLLPLSSPNPPWP